MKVTNKITIHLDDRRVMPDIHAVQCDGNTRELEFSLYEGGTEWKVPAGASVAVAYVRSDGSKGLYDTLADGSAACTVSGNVVTVILAPQALAVSGRTYVTVVLTDSAGDQLSTFRVTIWVEPNPAAGATKPEDYINLRQWLIEELEQYLANKGALYVNITENDGGTYSADKTFTELLEAYNAGQTICCIDGNMVLTLVQASATHMAFQAEITRYSYRYEIRLDDTVTRTVMVLALSSDIPETLPNPNKLTFTGAASGSYDGSDAVSIEIPTGSDAIPSYVKEEAERVASVVQNHQNANTLTFLACSDPHYSSVHTYAEQMKESLTHMGQAMGLLRKCLNIDFAAYLGDTVYGQGETNEEALSAMRFVSSCLADGFRGIPNFRMRGNYENLDSADGPTDTQVFTNIGIHNRGAIYDAANRESGYCYRDFEDWKLRVVLINTNETYTGSFLVSDAQCAWLADVLDLSALGAGWRSILLSHHPLDWNNQSSNIMQVIKAASGILCAFHGHVHGFRVDTITGTEITRIAIPNACFYRNNEYGRNGKAENNDGTEFGEETTYNKTAETGEDTAFCVITIDLTANKIYADHYGAGYDRVIPLDGCELESYSVTNTLSNVTSSNPATAATEGTSYSATLTAADGYYINSVTVTMGGTDVTATAYSGGKISIASVTGDIVITATAAELSSNYTNLVPTSLAADGTIYNGIGYKDGVYVSNGGTDGADENTVSVGYLKLCVGDVIYVKGAELAATDHVRLYTYKTNGSAFYYMLNPTVNSGMWTSTGGVDCFTIEQLGNEYYRLSPTENITDDILYRMSLYGTGANLIITHNEPIE